MITPLTNANGGPILSSLRGCSIGNGGNGIGTDSHLQKLARQRYSQGLYRAAKYGMRPSNITPNRVKDD